VFAAVQWPATAFLLSDAARNAVFLEGRFPYDMPVESPWSRGVFPDYWGTAAEYARGFAWAALAAVLSARAGLAWGGWMREVRR
jgi:hypothetical protein